MLGLENRYRGVQAPGGSGKKPSVEAVQLKFYFEKKKSGSQSFRAKRVLNDCEGFYRFSKWLGRWTASTTSADFLVDMRGV